MNDSRPPDDTLTPAEERLVTLLLLLRVDVGGGPQTSETMRLVRLQYAFREIARALGVLAAAVVDGLGVLLGGARPTNERGK